MSSSNLSRKEALTTRHLKAIEGGGNSQRIDTVHRGHLAALHIKTYMAQNGYICMDAAEGLPFDFIAYDPEKFVTKRVQSKTARIRHDRGRDGYVVISAKKSGSGERYDPREIDAIAAWDFEEGRAYIIGADRLDGRGEVWINKRSLYQL